MDLPETFLTELPTELFACAKLERLNVGCNISLRTLHADVAKLTNLRELDLLGCGFASLPDLGALTHLERLVIDWITPWRDVAPGLPPWITKLPHLGVLCVDESVLKRTEATIAGRRDVQVLLARGCSIFPQDESGPVYGIDTARGDWSA